MELIFSELDFICKHLQCTITIWLVGLPFLCPMGIIIEGERPKPITHLVSRKTEALPQWDQTIYKIDFNFKKFHKTTKLYS